MEFKKMVTVTLYAGKEKRHRCIEQTFGLCGRRRGWMIWENSIETYILSSMRQITSLGWMYETSAQGWCTGMTQKDGMGRKVEGGFSMGTHVNPWLIHVNVWQKPLQYCKVISLQLIKINEKYRAETLHCQQQQQQKKQCRTSEDWEKGAHGRRRSPLLVLHWSPRDL